MSSEPGDTWGQEAGVSPAGAMASPGARNTIYTLRARVSASHREHDFVPLSGTQGARGVAKRGGPESRAEQSGAVTGAGWPPEVRPVQQGLPGTAVSPEAEGTAQSSLGRVILSVTFVVSRE